MIITEFFSRWFNQNPTIEKVTINAPVFIAGIFSLAKKITETQL